MFTNSVNTFSPTSGNRCVLFNTGSYPNKYQNVIPPILTSDIRAINQFTGVVQKITSPATSGSQAVSGTYGSYVGNYVNNQPQGLMTSVQITETNSSLGNIVYEAILCVPYTNGGIVSRYILATGGLLSAYSSDNSYVISSVTSSLFKLARDGSTGGLDVFWANLNANTTQISFSIKPIASF